MDIANAEFCVAEAYILGAGTREPVAVVQARQAMVTARRIIQAIETGVSAIGSAEAQDDDQ